MLAAQTDPHSSSSDDLTSDAAYAFPPRISRERTRLLESEEDADLNASQDDLGMGKGEAAAGQSGWEGLTPLDETLEKIGMGKYQYRLLVLCGFGWMADNMFLQCIAVIIPRVQEHFDVSDRWIGLLSSSIFAGMMLGAWGWGSYSDSKGRAPAFNLTLLVTSIFGLLSSFAPSFPLLCLAMFCLGTGVGGSMPTDGTLYAFTDSWKILRKLIITSLPALSAFFSLGAVLTSLLGLYIIPRYSCPEHPAEGEFCDVAKQNLGWRYMLGSLGVISLIMFLSRIALFRLQESAKFLVTAGREEEAIIALQRISRINGEPMVWVKEDISDEPPLPSPTSNGGVGQYEATGESSPPSAGTPTSPRPGLGFGGRGRSSNSIMTLSGMPGMIDVDRRLSGSQSRSRSRSRPPPNSARGKVGPRPDWMDRLPEGLAESLDDYRERIGALFEPKWKLTTRLVWIIWAFASGGYTIFNVFLPKFLEEKVGEVAKSGGREESLRDYVLYTVSGMPGSLLGAYLVETSWGRRGTMAVSTIATSLGTFIFVLVSSQSGVVISSMVVSLAATLMYAVIYSYTPEVFEPRVRGTACGIASALSRLAGIVAPILTGLLLSINVSLPLFVSAGCFAVTAVCMILLPIETRGNVSAGSAGLSH